MNQQLRIGDALITVLQLGDGKVRLGIEAPRSVKVWREEVYQDDNRRAKVEEKESE